MSRLTTYLKGRVRRLLMARVAQKGGIDLSQLDKVPDSLAWPLHRDGPDPVARLGELREQSPVAKLTSFLGMNVWLVTGETEARQVLADTTQLQHGHPALHGPARLHHRRRHRRPRLHRPARAHPAAQAADPGVHDAPAGAAAAADRRDRGEPARRRRRPGRRERRGRRPGADVRVPDPVPGHLRAARPARRGPRGVPAAGFRPLRRVVRRHRACSAPSRTRAGSSWRPPPSSGSTRGTA